MKDICCSIWKSWAKNYTFAVSYITVFSMAIFHNYLSEDGSALKVDL